MDEVRERVDAGHKASDATAAPAAAKEVAPKRTRGQGPPAKKAKKAPAVSGKERGEERRR